MMKAAPIRSVADPRTTPGKNPVTTALQRKLRLGVDDPYDCEIDTKLNRRAGEVSQPAASYDLRFTSVAVPLAATAIVNDWVSSGEASSATLPHFIQRKLFLGTQDDSLEREADRTADHIVRGTCCAGCAGGLSCDGAEAKGLQTLTEPIVELADALLNRDDAVADVSQMRAPKDAREQAVREREHPIERMIAEPGQPLDAAIRNFFEPRFGVDFSAVRIHTGAGAAASARSIRAASYTVGRHITFADGRYAPDTSDGRRLLAHELAHVVQQRRAGNAAVIQRFRMTETSDVAPTYADMLAVIRAIINAATAPDGSVNMDDFVQRGGGQPASRRLPAQLRSAAIVPSMLNPRYLFTCRCGLLDMRHFIELLYISQFFSSAFPGSDGNRGATTQGREHELTSEPESRFGAEDTPSNAIGAFVGAGLAAFPRANDLLNAITEQLHRCDPVDWSALSPSSRDTVAHFYGDMIPDPAAPGHMIPKNQNTTAVPDVLLVPECGGRERSFPFALDTDDSDRKTIAGAAFDNGSSSLTSDSDIRDFVATQRPETIASLSSNEKIRLVRRLFRGWVSDEDLDAIESFFRNATADEKARIRASINPSELSDIGQRTRLSLLFD